MCDPSRASGFLVVGADPGDSAVTFVHVEEFDSIVDNHQISHLAGGELKARSDLLEGFAFVFGDRAYNGMKSQLVEEYDEHSMKF